MDRRRFLQLGSLAALGAACAGEAASSGRAPGTPSSPAPSPTAAGRPASPEGSPPPAPTPTPTAEPPPSPEPAAAVALGVLCRDAWGAAPLGEGYVEHTIRRLTLHHSAVVLGDNRNAPARFRQHQRYHRTQGWPDIAYHLGVDRRGNVYDLRPARFRGDTFTAYDPAGHFLVLCEGDFDREQPSDAQLEGAATAFAWAAGTFGAASDTLTGHRDHADTACPGGALYALLPDLRARVAELATRGVERSDRCGDEARAYVAAVEAGRA